MKTQTKDSIKEIYKQELIKIHKTQGLTAPNVVEVARDKKNPLHSRFEWNDTAAAEQYRLYQARILINSIEVEIVSLPQEPRAAYFESVVIENKRRYVPQFEILSNDDLRVQVINDAIKWLKHFKEKHEQYSEFKGISKEIEKIIEKEDKKEKNGTKTKTTTKDKSDTVRD